jgi:magnesium-protoporphyrin O-methyltransferase
MRAVMLSRLPDDLRGVRVLDAGCGAGQMTAELAARGADVVAVDISPSLVEIARKRLPEADRSRVTFASGDMLGADHGRFDFVLAMDSLIYYTAPDIVAALETLGARTRQAVVFTVAPRTPFLMTFFTLGKAFPRADRSPVMIPQAHAALTRAMQGRVTKIERVTSGFYISECLEYRP